MKTRKRRERDRRDELRGFTAELRGSAIEPNAEFWNRLYYLFFILSPIRQRPLYGDLTADEYPGFVADARLVAKGERSAKIGAAVEACGLGAIRGRRIETLSKGYKQHARGDCGSMKGGVFEAFAEQLFDRAGAREGSTRFCRAAGQPIAIYLTCFIDVNSINTFVIIVPLYK